MRIEERSYVSELKFPLLFYIELNIFFWNRDQGERSEEVWGYNLKSHVRPGTWDYSVPDIHISLLTSQEEKFHLNLNSLTRQYFNRAMLDGRD